MYESVHRARSQHFFVIATFFSYVDTKRLRDGTLPATNDRERPSGFSAYTSIIVFMDAPRAQMTVNGKTFPSGHVSYPLILYVRRKAYP
jgi:hypothetical protein